MQHAQPTWTVMLERGYLTPVLYDHPTKNSALRRADALAYLHGTPQPEINDDHRTVRVDATDYYRTRTDIRDKP